MPDDNVPASAKEDLVVPENKQLAEMLKRRLNVNYKREYLVS